MYKAKIDIPVALVFFNRPAQFRKVFETVREVRPSKLFLIQDGPRQNDEKDIENIKKCRKITENIDWDCEVTTDFSEENLGCGKRIYTGLTKCFEKVDRLVILEDDCVPSQSFFPFCKDLLEKYKDDSRVNMITGMNHLGVFDKVPSDYLFSCVGSIAGWATWRRSWENVNFDLGSIICDPEAERLLKNYEKYAPHRNSVFSKAVSKYEQQKRGMKLSSWSTQYGLNQILSSGMIIAPTKNLMSNIGLTEESANSVGNIKLVPRGLRPLYQLKLYELDFPLKHPKYVINDIEYCREVDKLMRPNKAISMMRKIESIFLRVVYGDFGSLKKGLQRKFKRIFK